MCFCWYWHWWTLLWSCVAQTRQELHISKQVVWFHLRHGEGLKACFFGPVLWSPNQVKASVSGLVRQIFTHVLHERLGPEGSSVSRQWERGCVGPVSSTLMYLTQGHCECWEKSNRGGSLRGFWTGKSTDNHGNVRNRPRKRPKKHSESVRRGAGWVHPAVNVL